MNGEVNASNSLTKKIKHMTNEIQALEQRHKKTLESLAIKTDECERLENKVFLLNRHIFNLHCAGDSLHTGRDRHEARGIWEATKKTLP